MYAFFDKIEGYIFLTNYDFIIEDAPLIPDEIDESIIQIMKASEILKILEKQNEIFWINKFETKIKKVDIRPVKAISTTPVKTTDE